MEELTPQIDGYLEQVEGVDITQYIDSVIWSQVNELLHIAPTRYVPVAELKEGCTPIANSDGSGSIVLPSNAIRPVLLQMTGWYLPVNNFIDVQDPLYPLQFNEHTRGTVSRPIAVLRAGEESSLVIEYYSLPKGVASHSIASLMCVIDYPATEDFDFHPLMVDALCYRCAAAVYEIMGNRVMAEMMKNRAML